MHLKERNGVSLAARRPIAKRERPKLLIEGTEVRRYEKRIKTESNVSKGLSPWRPVFDNRLYRYLFIPNLSLRMRRTLWLMRSSVMVPLLTAAITASKASVK